MVGVRKMDTNLVTLLEGYLNKDIIQVREKTFMVIASRKKKLRCTNSRKNDKLYQRNVYFRLLLIMIL